MWENENTDQLCRLEPDELPLNNDSLETFVFACACTSTCTCFFSLHLNPGPYPAKRPHIFPAFVAFKREERREDGN